MAIEGTHSTASGKWRIDVDLFHSAILSHHEGLTNKISRWSRQILLSTISKNLEEEISFSTS